jgi:hypothetical protein
MCRTLALSSLTVRRSLFHGSLAWRRVRGHHTSRAEVLTELIGQALGDTASARAIIGA